MKHLVVPRGTNRHLQIWIVEDLFSVAFFLHSWPVLPLPLAALSTVVGSEGPEVCPRTCRPPLKGQRAGFTR